MLDIFERIEEVLSDRVEVVEDGMKYYVRVTESGVATVDDFRTRETAETYADLARDRLSKK